MSSFELDLDLLKQRRKAQEIEKSLGNDPDKIREYNESHFGAWADVYHRNIHERGVYDFTKRAIDNAKKHEWYSSRILCDNDMRLLAETPLRRMQRQFWELLGYW